MTEQDIVQLFADASENHPSVQWFDFGTWEFLFSNNREVQYPAVFIQQIEGSAANEQTVHSFVVYAIDSPTNEVEVNHSAFEWDTRQSVTRDKTQQILIDIIGEVERNNKQDIFLEMNGATIPTTSPEGSALAGWRTSINITTDTPLNATDFS